MLTYRHGDDAARGGVDITVSLSAFEATALGSDAALLADWMDTVMFALVLLRTGDRGTSDTPTPPDLSDWYTVINDTHHRLLPRIEGIRDAAIREHAASGGSYRHLAHAMDTARSTAQDRRERLMTRDPSVWERWATFGRPPRDGSGGTPAIAACPTCTSTTKFRDLVITGDGRVSATCEECGTRFNAAPALPVAVDIPDDPSDDA